MIALADANYIAAHRPPGYVPADERGRNDRDAGERLDACPFDRERDQTRFHLWRFGWRQRDTEIRAAGFAAPHPTDREDPTMPDGYTATTEDAIAIKADELTNHVIGTVRDWFRAQRSPWGTMTHAEQSDLLHGIERLANDLVRDVVRTVAAEDRKVIVAKCEKVEFVEKGLKATFTASQTSEYRHELADSRGMDCLIVVADPSEFRNEERIEADAPKTNQDDLPFADDRPVFDNTAHGQDVRG
ncbi:MAG TPA: hypothetical protein VD860_12245 [Azospirillum sp.]|nr:hypothetical protein [Azospirillum sp.]